VLVVLSDWADTQGAQAQAEAHYTLGVVHMSFKNSRAKLMRRLMELPESKKHDQVPGMGMTWWQLAEGMMRSKKISQVKTLVRRAEEAELI